MPPRTSFEDTSVPVGRSQARIRDLLKESGALGVEFGEDYERAAIHVRFRWQLREPEQTGLSDRHDEPGMTVTVRLVAHPLLPDKRFTEAQRERQAWRGLYWYLKASVDAANFGLVRFEDVFLSFIEDPASGRTVGEVVINQLALTGSLQITAGAEA